MEAPAAARRVRAADLYPRQRTHYDDADLDAPFQTICGEWVQWVSRTGEGGALAVSNYRLYAQARRGGRALAVPLRLVDAVEVRDLTHIAVYCKDGRTVRIRLGSGEACAEWARRLCGALAPAPALRDTFAAEYAAWARELPPASAPRALLDPRLAHLDHNYWFKKEVQRLGFLARAAWRVSSANADYKLCASYPPLLIVPANIGDDELEFVARFRAARRLPAVVWRHRGNGAVLARSSQPEVGWLGWRSSEDERLLAALSAACGVDRGVQPPGSVAHKQPRLLIMDARSYTSAVTNRARGGGCECAQYYPHAEIQFMSLPNIHHVRKSFHLLRQLAADPPDSPNWHSGLERTLWLQHLSGLGGAAVLAARALHAGRPVLVHCSDGWDRTPQIVCATQMMLDQYYRTIEGFRQLVSREWLHFGHKFGERCGHNFGAEDPNERSPIFLQFLDLVHQMVVQFPCHFEFNQAYLIKLVMHAHSCQFGTFLCNSMRERAEHRVYETTAHVWRLLEGPAYRNHLYVPQTNQVLWLDYKVRSLVFWSGLYSDERRPWADYAEDVVQDSHNDAESGSSSGSSGMGGGGGVGGGMGKTRSCDNLAKELGREPAQRRCSDPTVAPDLMNELARISLTTADNGNGEQESSETANGEHENSNISNGKPESSNISNGESESSNIGNGECESSNNGNGVRENSHLGNGERQNSNIGNNLNGDADTKLPADPYSDVAANIDTEINANHSQELSVLDDALYTNGESAALSDSALAYADTPHPDLALGDISQDQSGIRRSPLMTGNSSSLERELAAADSLVVTNLPHESTVRARHISIGWRSVSESSQQTDVTDSSTDARPAPVAAALDDSLLSDDESETGVLEGPCAALHTLCPNSPARHARRPRTYPGAWAAGEGGGVAAVAGEGGGRSAASAARCVCGLRAGTGLPTRDSIDGFDIHTTPVQRTLHTIMLQHKRTVAELSSQVQMLRRQLELSQADTRHTQSEGTSSCETETSGEEVEVGEEAGAGTEVGPGTGTGAARGVVWLPDSAASRCQHCASPFWLARRRHHCRKCGGVFCGSCARVRDRVRVCGRCRR